MQKIDLGNNESMVCGVFPNQDGTFTAMTYTKSKTFKTETGARRWLAEAHSKLTIKTSTPAVPE